jgi:hypothetical protein
MKAAPPVRRLGDREVALLKELAAKHIWWKTPDEALEFPTRITAQAMNRGSLEEINALTHVLGEDYLKEIIQHAEAGQFNERSWHYWHYRLGLARLGEVPALPARRIP